MLRSRHSSGWSKLALVLSTFGFATASAQAHPGQRPTPLPSSAADASPPTITILKHEPSATKELIFVAPKSNTDGAIQGPEIIDNQGRVVWFHALANGNHATDFRVQRYRGQPVLTWSESQGSQAQGQPNGGTSPTETIDYVVDQSYRVIATVRAGNGLNADAHEFRLTPQGTALITIYHTIPFDTSSVGGSTDATVVDGIVQELDIATGRVLFEWHSVDHIALAESHAPLPKAGSAYDYFHINAVNVDTDGNYIISARNAWALYKLDRRTGNVRWRLGGTESDFTLGTDLAFAWQHDPEPLGFDTYRLFDNEASPGVRAHSRVIWIKADVTHKKASLLQAFEHPDGLLTGSQGNSQALEFGHTFVGWGALGRFSEFDARGTLVFDAQVPTGYDDYRAYRGEWHAAPLTAPTAAVTKNADGTLAVHASWNGATDVARWFVVGGPNPGLLWPLGGAAWNGLDTAIPIGSSPVYVAVVAADDHGHFLGRSEAVAVTP